MVVETFLAPESWPFSVALMLLLAITLIEGLSLLVGLSFSGWIDQLLPDVAALDNASEAWLGWLHIGKVPLLVLLVLLLTAFSIIGYSINAVVRGLLGFYPPPLLSGLLALASALPVVRLSGAALGRIIPRDETSAQPLDSLVGRVAIVINGTARCNYPAQARVRNDNGQTLYVHVEPDESEVVFSTGDSVLLVKQISGPRFQAIANPRPDLL